MDRQSVLFETLCRLGDNTLILGHRLSEWCGHAPALEEDIAVANTALDLIGQTQLWLGLAAETEGAGRSADDLAMRRDVWQFRNLLLVEQPNGDFGQTIMRQYLFDAWHVPLLTALESSSALKIAEIAMKSAKEARYHLERSREIVISLGDGTAESNRRMQNALEQLYPYTLEVFAADAIDEEAAELGLIPHFEALQEGYREELSTTLGQAGLRAPKVSFPPKGGKSGQRHSEHLGHLLTQMQWLQRAYPGATW